MPKRLNFFRWLSFILFFLALIGSWLSGYYKEEYIRELERTGKDTIQISKEIIKEQE